MILSEASYPHIWNIAFQVPLFKGGDQFDASNFRGISITSCLGKIFNKIINARILNKVISEDKLSITQAAYRPDFRTTDQILYLKVSLISTSRAKTASYIVALLILKRPLIMCGTKVYY